MTVEEIDALVEENCALKQEVKQLTRDKQEYVSYWMASLSSNEILEKELNEARQEWAHCAQNWQSAVKAYSELEAKYKELVERNNK